MRGIGLVLALALPVAAGAADADGSAQVASAIRAGDAAALSAAIEAAEGGLDTPVPPLMLTPLTLAALRGDLAAARTLLAAGADPDARHGNLPGPLAAALRSCRAGSAMVRLLLDAGADIEQTSGAGLTPLLVAIQEDRTDLALMLLAEGADVDARTVWGDGTLTYAIYTRNAVLVQALLSHQVDLSQLSVLFTTADYDPPGLGRAVPRHSVLCADTTPP